ncbi:Predicted metalloprotease, contains C-terminal PDZ domain [Roseateles sp. YR242]|uniref:M61 family metallopeptidase n=1 Tax=Roseateles sp. YR242 TaxID=1855305 RepID=UPI0008D3C8A0|nr:PDZ domain-containing protein [Roseateles sp. YR242]SEK57964.1 Predicted metalloprotease, contains C-terminal PDZ domain [Roseateles sp. YR242]
MIHYRIAIADLHAHRFEVSVTVPTPAARQVLSLPVWIPGSYLVREFSRHLGQVSARQGSRDVAVHQTAKNRWEFDCSGRGALVVTYPVYAFDTSVRAAFLDALRGFFNPTSLCLRAHGKESLVHRIELAGVPEGWEVATAMPQHEPGVWQAADYDELVDHPFELGTFWREEFLAGGVPHEFVVAGALPVFDSERLLRDAQRICEAQMVFWHGHKTKPPMDRYVFLLNCVEDGYGGLEHRGSTALIAARRDLPRLGQPEMSDGYVKLLGLISHEYFHTWNVKRLRPDAFAHYDYEQENYTQLLWFFEGFTSYYDDLFLVRSGLIDEPRYLKLIGQTFTQVLGAPGRKHQSVAQSSFEAWTKYYRQDENAPNALVSYYAKGSMVALALDLTLRSAERTSSLDDLMRALWRESLGGPISEERIFTRVAELGGEAVAQALHHWVHGCDDLPLPQLLERLGVRWSSEKPTLAQRLGVRVQEADGTLSVKQVLLEGAALAAGLSAGDEIVACNGWRIRKLDDLLLTLDQQDPQHLQLLVSRDQRMLTLTLALPMQDALARPVCLGPLDKAPARAQSLRRAWLGG